MKARFAVVLLAFLVAACASQVRPIGPIEAQPGDFPDAYYLDAAKQGKPVFRIDPGQSLVVMEVRRGGTLARYGHDHVIASHTVQGYVAPEAGRSDLYIALDRLVVDEPALRSEAGFDTQPTESDIAGTRANMLDKVLETGKYPFALVRVTGAPGASGETALQVAITLHGITREMPVMAQVDAGPGEIGVSGRLAFNQSDFGIAPFSILGGAIQVRDRVDLRFRIRARRAG